MESQSAADGRSKLKITHRTDRSVFMFILQHMVKIFNSQLIKPGKPYPAGSPQLEPHKSILKTCKATERKVEDIYIYDISPLHAATANGNVQPQKKRRLYYFAGGGWQMPPSQQHWKTCAEFANQLPDFSISLVSYPLAPNSPAPMAFPQMMRMYRKLLQDAEDAGESVVLAGDSAGGNIVLCLAMAALAEDETAFAPEAILVISPSTDLRRGNPDIKLLERHDPILRVPFITESAKKWRGDWDAADPRVSPLMADVSPLARRGVKVHGVVGSYDILSPDTLLFQDKCEKAGVEGEWLCWDKQMHVYPLVWPYKLQEGVESKDWIVDVLRRS